MVRNLGLILLALCALGPGAAQQSAPRPLLGFFPTPARTSKPLAVAEGGRSSKRVGRWPGSATAQIAYLRAIRDQLGPRLAFWIYLL